MPACVVGACVEVGPLPRYGKKLGGSCARMFSPAQCLLRLWQAKVSGAEQDYGGPAPHRHLERVDQAHLHGDVAGGHGSLAAFRGWHGRCLPLHGPRAAVRARLLALGRRCRRRVACWRPHHRRPALWAAAPSSGEAWQPAGAALASQRPGERSMVPLQGPAAKELKSLCLQNVFTCNSFCSTLSFESFCIQASLTCAGWCGAAAVLQEVCKQKPSRLPACLTCRTAAPPI